jgi:hypothetical protein
MLMSRCQTDEIEMAKKTTRRGGAVISKSLWGPIWNVRSQWAFWWNPDNGVAITKDPTSPYDQPVWGGRSKGETSYADALKAARAEAIRLGLDPNAFSPTPTTDTQMVADIGKGASVVLTCTVPPSMRDAR